MVRFPALPLPEIPLADGDVLSRVTENTELSRIVSASIKTARTPGVISPRMRFHEKKFVRKDEKWQGQTVGDSLAGSGEAESLN